MMKDFVKKLFNTTESTCFGGLYNSKIESIEKLDNVEFFCINPISAIEDFGFKKKEEYHRFKPRRADMNVTSFRSFLFEMDNAPLNDQLNILENCGIPFTSIVYSGGKSYHGILTLETPLDGAHTDEGIIRYKHIWKRLAAKINKYSSSNTHLGSNVVDPSCKNPSRFSRFPDYTAKDRSRQDLILLKERISCNDFSALLLTCPEVKDTIKTERKELDITNELEFFKIIPEGLKNQIRFPLWIQENGNYPQLFRITKWIIDETGIEEEFVVDLFDKYITPKCERVGYSRDRVLLAIEHGYGG